jgi:diphthamide synthase subunit DPH2
MPVLEQEEEAGTPELGVKEDGVSELEVEIAGTQVQREPSRRVALQVPSGLELTAVGVTEQTKARATCYRVR